MPIRSPRFPLLTVADWDRWTRELEIVPDVGSVGPAQIDSEAVTESKLGTNAVSTVKIQLHAVTNEKLALGPATSVVCNPTALVGDRTDLAFSVDGQLLVRRAGVLTAGALVEADIPATIARDTEVAAAITAHEAAADPHPGYVAAGELTAALAALNLASGTYTPTLTNVANLDASTAYECQYLRVGSVVTVSGKVDVNPTLAATSTQLGISLPVASNLGAAEDCSGTAFASGITGQGAAILGDTTNDRAQMQWIAGDVSNQAMYFQFTYQII